MRSRAFIAIILLLLLVAPGCGERRESFGGGEYSQFPLSRWRRLALELVSSPALVMRVGFQNARLNDDGSVKNLRNQVTSFDGFAGPLDLLSPTTALARVIDGWVELNPGLDGLYLQSSLMKDLRFNKGAVIALVKSASRGKVISLNPLSRDQQAFEVEMSSSSVRARYLSSAGNQIEAAMNLPAEEYAIVAFSYDGTLSAASLNLAVNGALAPAAIVTGNPGSPALSRRVIAFGSARAGERSALKELLVFTRALSLEEMGAMIRLTAANHGITGLELDPALGEEEEAAPQPNEKFLAAQAVIENSCTSCHSGWSGKASGFYLDTGLVIAGNPLQSKLYYRMKGSAGANGPKNMPTNATITAADVQKVHDWISSMSAR
jgi:mono/diheme cytochrome c family protein